MLALCKRIAAKVMRSNPRADRDELVSVGLEAIAKFDDGCDLASKVAYWKVRYAMLEWIRSSMWVPRRAIHRQRMGEKVSIPRMVSAPWAASVVADGFPLPDEVLVQFEQIEQMIDAIEGLDQRSRHIVRCRLRSMTWREVGAELGLSDTACRVIHSRAVTLMREAVDG